MGNALFCPMIDARRMEVYTSFLRLKWCPKFVKFKLILLTINPIFRILRTTLFSFLAMVRLKCRNAISHPHAIFIDGIITTAENMVSLAERDFKLQKFVDVAYYEPFYLKDFVATIPIKNIFK